MDQMPAELAELARAYGIATEFADSRGRATEVPQETVVAVLAAMGVDAGSPEAVAAARAGRVDEAWRRMLPPCVVVRDDREATVEVHVEHGAPARAWIEFEDGRTGPELVQVTNDRPPRGIEGRLIGEASFAVPDSLPLGYHRLHARSGDETADCALVVTPGRLPLPPALRGGRTWGLAAQLYSVRSRGSWGVGDLADLADLATWSAVAHGAGFVLVNPLHAAAPVAPMEPSPYLPVTRRFANPLYLRIEAVAEFAYLDEGQRRRANDERARPSNVGERIDRDTSWTAKRAALEAVFSVPRTPGRELAFQAYRQREGAGLHDFATWCAIAEEYGPDWHAWPTGLRHPGTPGVAGFAEQHADRIQFHAWLQWQLDEQLAGAQAAATRAGMPLGVVHDLAVGVDPNGADAWAMPDVFAQRVSVGAPPDPYNQAGQDWEQPPWRPDRLAELEYGPFRQMVSTVLRHAGGIRVDHVIGLFRLWWIPEGAPPTAGTYVRYDHDALVGILALEAARAGGVLVGEDLGTVEPWVRDYLEERGIFGTSVLWFEYAEDGGPLPASQWRSACLASVTTHDLPPTLAYLAGDHVRLRDELGVLTRSLEDELATAEQERHGWLAELVRAGELASVDAPADEVLVALHRYLGRSPSRLLCLALTDAVGDRRAQNQPGTREEYPNWRVALSRSDGRPMLLEDVVASPRAAELAEVLRAAAAQ